MEICGCVLAMLAEYHLRERHAELEDDVESGEYFVIRAVEDALKKQAQAGTLDRADKIV